MTRSRAALSVLSVFLLLLGSALPSPSSALDRPLGVQLYNEACRLSIAGDQERALATLRQAFDAGFDDPRFALDDPDLALLVGDPGFQALINQHLSRLHLLSSERGFTLAEGRWSEPLELVPDQAEPAAGSPTLELAWQPEGLAFRLDLQDAFAQWAGDKTPPPWSGGPGLVLSVGVTDTLSAFESRGHFIFAFGLEKSSPVGGMYADRLGWQRVLQLDPDLNLKPGEQTLTMTGLIPWESLHPFGPLSDSPLGFNAAVRTFRPDGNVLEGHLFPDPADFQPGRAVRRFVPLRFSPESARTEALEGRVDSSINRGQTLTLHLSALANEAGSGTLAMDFRDNKGQSLLPNGPVQSAIVLEQGLNTWNQQADFSRLNMGLYSVVAELKFPSGNIQSWSSRILQLGPDWQQEFNQRIEQLPAAEQPTARYYLTTVLAALGRIHPRFDPGPLGTTLGDLDRLLVRHAQTGTIVPDQGTMLLVYPGPGGQERLCTLYLPEGFRQRGPLNPVILMSDAAGFEPRLAMRLARSYEFEGHLTADKRTTARSPFYLIPHPVELQGDILAQSVAETRAVLDWTRSFFGVETVSLCGVDRLGGPALSLASRPTPGIGDLLIMAGRGLNPWPQAGDSYLAEQLAGLPADLPVTWIDFFQESRAQGQGSQLLQVLKALERDPAGIVEVRGGLSLTQIADRLVLWAESLP